jgi:hypothetical protein
MAGGIAVVDVIEPRDAAAQIPDSIPVGISEGADE